MQDESNLSDSGASASSSGRSSVNRSLRVAEKRKIESTKDSFQNAVQYFARVPAGTAVKGNDAMEAHLVEVERVAHSRGLPPEAISVMLEYAMSLRMGKTMCPRVLKILIPASVVPQEAVVRGISYLCHDKLAPPTQVLFVKWVLTVFDLIDAKDDLRKVYGFIFHFVTNGVLCPFICHLLYLLTRKEHVRPFRVRKLLELQAILVGKHPYLSHLLSLYKTLRPEMLSVSIRSQMKPFKPYDTVWKAALRGVQTRNNSPTTSGLGFIHQGMTNFKKRKRPLLELPSLDSAIQTSPDSSKMALSIVQSFPQLIKNIHRIEYPAQMGSLLRSNMTLHFLNTVQNESALYRFNLWLGNSLHEEFLSYGDKDPPSSTEALQFLNMLLSAQVHLQEGFPCTEAFLYKYLVVWDGSLYRSQILGLLSYIRVVPSSCICQVLFEPLQQLFFTSTLSFKCDLMDCLTRMLLQWLTWHSVYGQEDVSQASFSLHYSTMHMSPSAFMDSVRELVLFAGRLASVGLRLEDGHALLFSSVLDFYQTVCEMFMKFELPLMEFPPEGVFYPALLSMNPVIVNRLAHIVTRYRNNLKLAKSTQLSTQDAAFSISRAAIEEFNSYASAMANTWWNAKLCLPDIGFMEEQLEKNKILKYNFDLLHHPAFLCFAMDFYRKIWPKRKSMDLNSIKLDSRLWNWYHEYLYSQGFEGIRQLKACISQRPTRSQITEDSRYSEKR